MFMLTLVAERLIREARKQGYVALKKNNIVTIESLEINFLEEKVLINKEIELEEKDITVDVLLTAVKYYTNGSTLDAEVIKEAADTSYRLKRNNIILHDEFFDEETNALMHEFKSLLDYFNN